MYDLGILGGMGSQATAKMFNLLVENTSATNDQEHLNVVIINYASMPDRTKSFLDNNVEALLEVFTRELKKVDELEVKNIVITCNTAHFMYHYVKDKVQGRIINLVDCTLQYISRNNPSTKVCVLGTLGTVKTRLFEQFNQYGLEIRYPEEEQCKEIQSIIYEIKNTRDVCMNQIAQRLTDIMTAIREQEEGNVTFILGCTELSLIDKSGFYKYEFVDPLEIAALLSILKSGRNIHENKLKYNYKILKEVLGNL